MSKEILTNLQIGIFLKDFQKNAIIEIVEGAQEKNEIVKIASARGINLKDNKDLLGLKAIYAFANRANSNGDYLPEKPLLKALPSIIGKPVNLSHDRRFVLGHILDYRYQQKEKRVIAYFVIYKSCFGDEIKALKKDFADKKLTVSFEIWSPEKKRKVRPDGSTELHDMTMAGMALLPRDTDPAFKGANVLAIARKRIVEEKQLDLVYASQYKSTDIITAEDYFKKEVEKNIQKIKEDEKINPVNIPKIKCSNCQEEFESSEVTNIKCPKCFAVINKLGEIIYPPQIKNFRVSCPSCGLSDWLILSHSGQKAKLRCLNDSCGKEYEIEFAVEKSNELLDKMRFVYIKPVSCLQCGRSIGVSTTSHTKNIELTCPKCGLVFIHDISKGNKDIQITKINEIIEEKSSEKGGEDEVKKTDDLEKNKVEETPKEEIKTPEEPKVEETPKEKEEKTTEEESKIEAPKSEEQVEPKPDVKASALKSEEIKEELTPEKNSEEKESPTSEVTASNKKSKVLSKAVAKILILKKENKNIKENTTKKENVLKIAINKVVSQLIKAKAEIKKIKSEADKKIELYRVNAKTILKRREELGEDYGKDLSDEDILNADKFEKASLKKEVLLLKASREDTNDIVGDKTNENEDTELLNKKKEIDLKAFPEKKRYK